MSPLLEILISAALILGGVFGLIGSFGLLKLRDPLQRLHAPTKATTLGVGAVLVASGLEVWAATGIASWSEVLVAAFLFLTAPLTALYLAKAHLLTLPRRDLPATGTDRDWAQFDTPDPDHAPDPDTSRPNG